MRVLRVLVSVLPLIVFSGCGYVHFGRLPKVNGDAALQQANFDLGTQQKILKQELALARKETDTLRNALERAEGAPPERPRWRNSSKQPPASWRPCA